MSEIFKKIKGNDEYKKLHCLFTVQQGVLDRTVTDHNLVFSAKVKRVDWYRADQAAAFKREATESPTGAVAMMDAINDTKNTHLFTGPFVNEDHEFLTEAQRVYELPRKKKIKTRPKKFHVGMLDGHIDQYIEELNF